MVPYGTDTTQLTVKVVPPAGRTVSPASGTPRDFSAGPVKYTLTAEDGYSKKIISVTVKVSEPPVTERPLIGVAPGRCWIAYIVSADSSVKARVLLPFAPDVDCAKIDAIRATLAVVSPLDALSFAWADANGSVTPITAKGVGAAAAVPPYLQIAFTAKSLNDLKQGALTKLEYWLKNDTASYAQTLSPGLSFNSMTLTDETPEPEPQPEPEPGEPEPELEPEPDENEPAPSGTGGGCNAAGAAETLLLGAAFLLARMQKTR